MSDLKIVQNKEVAKSIPDALVNFDDLPDSAFIRLPTLKMLYGISASSCWRGVKRGSIPQPVRLSDRCTCWNVGAIRAALAAKVA